MSNPLFSVWSRAYGSAVILAHLKDQSKIPYLAPEEIGHIRDARVRRIVRYAASAVPFYRDFFRANRMSASEIRGAADLKLLPLITKDEVRAQPERFRSDRYRGRRAIPLLTSGSTGQRLTVWHDRESLLAQAAFGERERDVKRQMIGGGIKGRILKIAYPNCTPETIWGFYREAAFTPIKPNSRLVSIALDLEAIVREIAEFRPDILTTYGSFADVLFRGIKAKGYKGPLPKLVETGGDAVSSSARDFIQDEFGIPVISSYGAVECLRIGYECKERTGFHIHEDLCHVEIMVASGEAAKPGEVGEIVISNLINFGTVLLNYRIGDLAAPSPGCCQCGRTSKLISELHGRVEDLILLIDGKVIHPRRVWGILKKLEPIRQYQFIQHSLDEFELKLVTSSRASFEGMRQGVQEAFTELLGENVRLTVSYYKTLERSDSGKFHPVLSKVSRSRVDAG